MEHARAEARRPAAARLRECRPLLDVLRAPPGSPLEPVTGWPALVALADGEDLAPALAEALRSRGWAGVPAGARVHLEHRFRQALARHVLMSRDLARVLRELTGAGVETMPLKGPVLAETLYPHPATRTFSDLDLLVRPRDLPRADAALRGLGWRRTGGEHSWDFDVAFDGETTYQAPGRATVDVHWRLLNAARYPWNGRATDEAWRRARPVTVAGCRTLALAPVDLLVYLAAHLAVQHAGVGLRWHLDLARLVDRGGFDWGEVVRRAREWAMARATAFALACLQATSGAPVPAAVARALAGRGPRAACTAAVSRTGEDTRRRCEHAMPFLLADRARELWPGVRQVLLPPRAWVVARYGAGGTPRRYAAHYRRLFAVVRAAVTGARDRAC